MGRLKWSERNPDWKDREGKPLYDKRAKVKIWSEKLKAEFFPGRKPTQSQRLQIAAAVCLALDLSEAHANFQASKPLPKNYLQILASLQRILDSFRGKAPRNKKTAAKNSGGLGLAAILGGE